MNRIFLLLLLIISADAAFSQQQTMSPKEFLGYEIGEQFTRHHLVVEYYEHVAETNPNVKLIPYGKTYENRPLMVAVVSSEENMNRLEEIRLNNLRRTGLKEGTISEDKTAIVWLSYNIHGNEASSVEASMLTIFSLVDPSNGKTKDWLKNTVVVIDPCVNPDGRERYVNFYQQYGSASYNPNPEALEHHEPWPGGRPNHYLFDLNRDWAWQTQIESRQRSEIYHQWMPHVHVDFHEQGVNSPYYFAPAAEPFHEVITTWQREFQTEIGRNNANYFDKEGWLYFTKERFDLLYPSYGDTYPTYNGAIGMTYEQAGHGMAGLGIITEYGDTLTLSDRAVHHHTTGLSTIEVASGAADKVVREFEKYFRNNGNEQAKYKSYIIKGNSNRDKVEELLSFLDKNKISYGMAPQMRKAINGFNYQDEQNRNYTLSNEDILIPVDQPLGRLVTVFFEPKVSLSDTLTYDITAWALPYAYGVNAFASETKIHPSGVYKPKEKALDLIESPYAWIAEYNSFNDAKFLAYLSKHDINVRVARKQFVLEGKSYNRGSLVITRRTNESHGLNLSEIIKEGAEKYNCTITGVSTGMATSGTDLGSGDISRIIKPTVAVLAGEQTSSLAFGEIWHYFERQLDYPVNVIGTKYFNRIDLDEYNVLIVPHGYYALFDDNMKQKLSGWVREGGKLILMGNAMRSFADSEGFSLKNYESEEEKKKYEQRREELMRRERLHSYEISERAELSRSIFGAIYKIKLDSSHPLAFGYNEDYFTLKTSELRFAFLEEGGNVGTLQGSAIPVSGHAGFYANKNLQNSLVFGVENAGSGTIIYMVDDPLFRAFWQNGKLLFANAVFLVGS